MPVHLAAGGGRRVTHVEVSLDCGASWRLAPVSHGGGPSQEDRADNSHLNAYGKHWSWWVAQVKQFVWSVLLTFQAIDLTVP